MEQRILLKIGGRAFGDKSGFQELAQAIKTLPAKIILLHGGGAEISQALREARRETVFVDGVRITQKEDVEIVEKVLSETVNGRIAAWLEEFGVPCRRLSGKSESLMIAEKTLRNGRDIGHVGEIVAVNPQVILETLAAGRVPVVSPISATVDGITLNVNADTAAAALAVGAHCTDLVYFSDVPGVMDAQKTVIADLPITAAAAMIRSGVIIGGMIAKLESIFAAVRAGVKRVHITQWQGSATLDRLINGGEIIKTTIHE
jgi:acetylglutamate kinase